MANDNNQDVFDIEIAYSSTGDDEVLQQANEIQDAIDDINQHSNLDVEFDLSGEEDLYDVADEIDQLSNEDISTDVNVDSSELTEADRLRENLEEDTTTTANVEDDQLQEANDKLDAIKNFEVLNFVWNVAGTLVDFARSTADFTVGPILEYDSALSTIQARTGEMIPDARTLIGDLYTDGWGDSREQIADVIVQADQLGISMDDLEEATRSAFEVSAVTGDDVQTSLRTINNLATAMGISYSDAADLIVAGTQDGANAAGDLQEALVEFGPKFSEMRISGEGALSIIESGLANGAKSASDVSDGIKELGNNISKIGEDEGVTTAFNQLDKLSSIDLKSQLDLYNQGKLSGDDFYQGIFDALNEVQTTNPGAAQDIGTTLIGGKAEDMGVGIFANLETSFDETATAIEGRATEAGTAIHDNIGSKFTEVTRSIGDSIAQYLEDNTGLDEFLDNFKQGMQDTIDALKSGKSVEEAITIGLKPLGFDDEFQKLESIFGNLIIGFLQIVADVQSLLGKDNSGTKAEIARLSTNQLAFDLKVANGDEIATAVKTALDRGVSEADISKAGATAITEAINTGDLEQAQTILDNMQRTSVLVSTTIGGIAQPVQTVTQGLDESYEDFQKRLNDWKAMAESDVSVAVKFDNIEIDDSAFTGLQDQIDEASKNVALNVSKVATPDRPEVATGPDAGGNTRQTQILADTDALTAAQQRQSDSMDEVTTSVDDHITKEGELRTTFDATTTSAGTLTDSVDELATSAGEATDGIDAQTLANSDLGESLTDSVAQYQALEAQLAAGTISVEQFNAAVETLIATAQAAASAASGGGGGSTTNVTLNQTNNIASGAEGNGVGVVTADEVKGFGGG